MQAQHPVLSKGTTVPQFSHPSTLLTSVKDSHENLFSSNLMPLPPKFKFSQREGRVAWRQLLNCDVNEIEANVDLR